jgi:hypothetical protein
MEVVAAATATSTASSYSSAFLSRGSSRSRSIHSGSDGSYGGASTSSSWDWGRSMSLGRADCKKLSVVSVGGGVHVWTVEAHRQHQVEQQARHMA